jgi:hypothetical protein
VTQPNTDLLAEYGTDEVYLANLEKVADDTRFGPSMAAMGASEWARLVTGISQGDQANIDRQRAAAAALNMQFRHLESQAMANTIENFGGAGTRRSAYTRAMQTQPYAVHPLLFAGGMGGGMSSMMLGGGMMPASALGGMGLPMGAGAHREIPAEAAMAEGAPDSEMSALEGEMAVEASVDPSVEHPGYTKEGAAFADMMGRDIAHRAVEMLKEAAYEDDAYQMGRGAGQVAQGIGEMSLGAGRAVGEGAHGLGEKAIRALKVPGKLVGSAARGFRNWMSQDVQPTPNWGTGFTPARDVNQYGQPIY